MNKDEMKMDIKEILKKPYGETITLAEHYISDKQARMLYNANYRKIADDEIVVKKSEYKKLKKYRTDWLNSEKMHLQAELEDTEFELGCSNRLFQKVCEEKKELEKQLERYKNIADHYFNECTMYGSALEGLNDK